MNNLTSFFRNQVTGTSIGPAVFQQLKAELDSIDRTGKSIKRVVEWEKKILHLQGELRKIGGLPSAVVNAEPKNQVDYERILNGMREILEKQPPKVEPLQNKTYLRHSEACDYLCVSEKTLFDWKQLGYIKDYKINRAVVYKRTDLDEALAKFGRQAFKTPKRRAQRLEEVDKTVPPQPS